MNCDLMVYGIDCIVPFSGDLSDKHKQCLTVWPKIIEWYTDINFPYFSKKHILLDTSIFC